MPDSPVESGFADTQRVARVLGSPVGLIFAVLGLMWAAEIVDYLLPYQADLLGIQPRSARGLLGVPLAPFLHAGFGHLASNSIPLLVLGLATALRARAATARILIFIVLVSGLGIWLFSPPNTITIGASGLIFGLMGYLVAAGPFTRRAADVALSILVLIAYGGTLLAATPFGAHSGVSWVAHLSGIVAGVLAASLYAPRHRRSRSVGT